jgi:acetyl-CoA carboxylase carboxyl transferase subunit beta
MASLVGIPRLLLALQRLAAAGVPHIAVADHPTTGGVYVAVVAHADLRLAVSGATVGFSGPRVVEAMTGTALPPGANTAESAYAAGLVDAVVSGDEVGAWLGRALAALSPTGRELVGVEGAYAGLLGDVVALRAYAGDNTVAAGVGHLADGRPVVACALAARPGVRPTPAGFALLSRAAEVADRWRLPLVTVVDTPGADPAPPSEDGGVAAAIARSMHAVLQCGSPTLAVVVGEGGSGGALAAAVADEVVMCEGSYFAAIAGPGAAATLGLAPDVAVRQMAVTPVELGRLGFTGPPVPPPGTSSFVAAVAAALDRLAAHDVAERLARRRARWSAPLPGRLR